MTTIMLCTCPKCHFAPEHCQCGPEPWQLEPKRELPLGLVLYPLPGPLPENAKEIPWISPLHGDREETETL